MEIKKQTDLFNQEIFYPSLNFENKELSTFLLERNYECIDLDKLEVKRPFLTHVLTDEKLFSLSNIYLGFLKDNFEDKFNELKHESGFDVNEVLDSLCSDLQEDSSKKDFIFEIQKKKYAEEFKGIINPLEEILYQPFIKYFADALRLTFTEQTLFLLGMINYEWHWLLPENKDEEYKSRLFCSICNAKRKSPVAYARKINRRLIQLGLFSSSWTVNQFVYSFFKNETVTYSLERIKTNLEKDIFDYDDLSKINSQDFDIIFKLTEEHCKQNKGCWQIISSGSDFRNKNYIAAEFEKHDYKVYELKKNFELSSETELAFYILSLSVQLAGKKSVIFLSSKQADILLKNEDTTLSQIYLQSVKAPVILSTENLNDKTKKDLAEKGINALYSLDLKLPEKDSYNINALSYYCQQKVPENLISVALDCSIELKLGPEKWDEAVNLLKTATSLSKEAATLLMKNHFSGSRNKELRKNSHYSLEALNTTEPLSELASALKNAEEQKREYDSESGIKTLLYGISGGGKTAYVEELAKLLDKPLEIVHPSEVLSPYVGETEQNISRIFKTAADDKAILLIDEADSFLHPRGDNVNHHNDSKVNSFLIEIERFPGILFCNTNLPENLDKALDRRFNFKIGFNPLTRKGVELLCKSYFEELEISDKQISEIYSTGDVTPGDFGALNGKLRFLPAEKRTAEYITEELCKIVRGKKRSYENKKIGFGL